MMMHNRLWKIAALALFVASSALGAGDKVALEIEAGDRIAPRGAGVVLDVSARIEDGWHINAHEPNEAFLIPTRLDLEVPAGIEVADVVYPPPEKRSFAFAPGKQLLVYEGVLGIAVLLQIPADYSGDRIDLKVDLRYQACNDTTCLRPANAVGTLSLRVVAPDQAAGDAVFFADAPGEPPASGNSTRFAAWLAERGLIFTLFAVALLGLGLNLTPCVYPLISVTIAYFGGQNASRSHVAWLAFLYVIGIALTFSTLGVAAALSGGFFGAAMQKPPVIAFISALMFVLALGSFGVYQLQPPAALLRRVGGSGSGAAGALFMGLTMGIVAAPCVGPIVLGLLLFIGSRQDPLLGFLLFFVLALGMGAPYLLLALAAGSIKRLPRSGEWLLWVEHFFGCVLLAMGVYFLTPLLPAMLKPVALPLVVGLSGAYLGFIATAGRGVPGFSNFKRLAGAALVVFALWLGLPTSAPGRILWEPADGLPAHAPPGKPLLIDFVAEWCIPCREMDHSTYVDAQVISEAERFHMVKADITQENEATSRLVEEFAVLGVPTVILRSPAGHETHRMVGYVGPEELLRAMREVN
jgi:thiol:disulfide interchange protein DsbD